MYHQWDNVDLITIIHKSKVRITNLFTAKNRILSKGQDITLPPGITALVQDAIYNNLTIPEGSTLTTNGFRLIVQSMLTVNGIISNDGQPGISGDGVNIKAGGIGAPKGTLGGGAAGGASSSNSLISGVDSPNVPINGTSYFAGGSYIDGTCIGILSPSGDHLLKNFQTGYIAKDARGTPYSGGAGGTGGIFEGLPGGSGGGGGGVIVIYAFQIVGNGIIRARGGNGGNGYAGASIPPQVGGAGGGGGGGLIVFGIINPLPSTITVDVSGGDNGTGPYIPKLSRSGTIYLVPPPS